MAGEIYDGGILLVGTDNYRRYNTVAKLEANLMKWFKFSSNTRFLIPKGTLQHTTISVVQSGGTWTWTNIRSVNIFFENYGKVLDKPENLSHFIGEAHFFKAWFYYDLVRAYGDVPWFTNSLQMTSPELYNARTPRTQVVDSIL